MRISDILAIVSLATACLINPVPAAAGKPSGGGSGIKVEELVKPAGSRDAYAADINDSGTIAVGAAYWNATWDYTNNYYAVRWTRASTSDPWVAEDLRLRFPPSTSTRAYLVNDAGTIVLTSFSSPYHVVMTSTGDVIDLGAGTVSDLSNNDTMVGYRSSSESVPLFWVSPSSPPEELPLLDPGHGGNALWFEAADRVIGTADDFSGVWLVRWVSSGGSWSVHRIVKLPDGVRPVGMNSAGRLVLMVREPTTALYEWDQRAAVWDPPYEQPPIYLPTLSGTADAAGSVLEDGTVVGVVTASSKSVRNWLPVIWPAPTSLVKLPLLSGAKYGATYRVNAYRQIAGAVVFVEGWATVDHAVVWTLP